MARTVRVAAIITALLLVRCPGGGGSGGGGSSAAGKVLKLGSPTAKVAGVAVGGGEVIKATQHVTTTASGSVDFSVSSVITSCREWSSSNLVVAPNSSTALQWVSGSATCSTNKNSSNVQIEAGGAHVIANDPVFTIVVQEGDVTIRVAFGFVLVGGQGLAETGVPIGPNQQLTVGADGAVQGPAFVDPASLPGEEASANEEFTADLPQPDFGRPDPEGSEALQRILDSGTLRVGLDGDAIQDRGTKGFVQSFFGFLANSWDVALDFGEFPSADVVKALQGREIDIAVSPQPVSDAQAAPFFSEPGATSTWSTTILPDDSFLAAIQRFLDGTLQVDVYGSAYRDAFGTEPEYVAVLPLITT